MIKRHMGFIYLFSSLILGACSMVNQPVPKERFGNQTSISETKTSSTPYFTNNHLRFHDHIYRDYIKTVILTVKGVEASYPLLDIDSNEQLHLQFDDLEAEQRTLYYSLEHCNADWTPSNTIRSQVMLGMHQDFLTEFRYSFNTFQQYLHYDLFFPNENMKLLLTGNYLLKVYEDGDPDNLVLTRRFFVYRERAKVGAIVKRAGAVPIRDTHQEIDIVVDAGSEKLINPMQSLQVMIMQNGRWDNMITNLKPFSFTQNVFNYDYDDGRNCFPGGNEFRWFDTRSLRLQSDRIRRINRDSTIIGVELLPDPVRSFSSYTSLQDANDRFFIRNTEGSDPQVDADYVWVQFSLPYDYPLTDGNLFVFGALSDWQFREGFKLTYDFERKAYRGKFLLKQGIYNYNYIFVPFSTSKGDEMLIENSFFNTENDYLILVYYRAYTNIFDELIGVSRVNSIRR